MISLIRAVYMLPLITAILFAGSLLADEKAPAGDSKAAKAAAGSPPEGNEMMKKMMEYATPGPEHKVLEALVGEWEVQTKAWMGPDAPAMESKGTTKVQWILGGRFLREEFAGEMMQMPFQGTGLTGYDKFNSKYVGIWIDSMGTGVYTSEGTASEGGKVLTFTGKMDEPVTGVKAKPTKYVITIISPDKHTFEMHDLTLGEKSKVFEMTYTRKK